MGPFARSGNEPKFGAVDIARIGGIPCPVNSTDEVRSRDPKSDPVERRVS